MTRRLNAVTLVEILIVVVIIMILTGILFPMFGRAKRASYGTVSLNNLRQTWMATSLYMDNYSDSVPPRLQSLLQIVPAESACSPLDDWHHPCKVDDRDQWQSELMIGSFGYYPEVASAFGGTFEGQWADQVKDCSVQPLFVDPFGRSEKSCPWFSSWLTARGWHAYMRECKNTYQMPPAKLHLPDRVSFIDIGGSAMVFCGSGKPSSWAAVASVLSGRQYCKNDSILER